MILRPGDCVVKRLLGIPFDFYVSVSGRPVTLDFDLASRRFNVDDLFLCLATCSSNRSQQECCPQYAIKSHGCPSVVLAMQSNPGRGYTVPGRLLERNSKLRISCQNYEGENRDLMMGANWP